MYYIGLSGEQGSGKDTVAGMIKQQYPRRTEIVPFSRPIKKIMKEIFLVDPEVNKNTANVSTLARGEFLLKRTLMQKIGSSFRSIYKDIFVDLLLLELKNTDAELIIIPDVRYNNEAVFVKANGGMLVKVESNSVSINTDHESEHDWHSFKFDIELTNTGEKKDLYTQIREKVFPRIPSLVFKRSYEGYSVVKESELIGMDIESNTLIEIPLRGLL